MRPANIHQPSAMPPPVTSAVRMIHRIGERAGGATTICDGMVPGGIIPGGMSPGGIWPGIGVVR